ncbi:MAG: HAD family hydrolase [Pseudomonadota bacterium]
MNPIELVIFDCDGVLIDSEGLSAEVLLALLADQGLTLDFDYFCVNFVGRSFHTVADDIRRTFDMDLPIGFEDAYRTKLLEAFEARLQPTPGIKEAVARLRPAYCVATSSSPKRAHNSLRIAGLTEVFGANVFTASQVNLGKPAPDLFLFTAEQMGVDPAACLVIEDSLPGIDAAVGAGMEVLRFTGGAHLRNRRLKHRMTIRTFDNWPDLFQLMPSLEAR